ncbi:MAG: hypothetical protein ABSG89_06205 [Bacteroidales bacterium]|jgi:hypothetical protein
MSKDKEEIVRLKAEIVKLSDDIVFLKQSYENTIAGFKTIINNYGVRLGLDPVRTLRVSYKNNGSLIQFPSG